jgi:hypothetical protein
MITDPRFNASQVHQTKSHPEPVCSGGLLSMYKTPTQMYAYRASDMKAVQLALENRPREHQPPPFLSRIIES